MAHSSAPSGRRSVHNGQRSGPSSTLGLRRNNPTSSPFNRQSSRAFRRTHRPSMHKRPHSVAGCVSEAGEDDLERWLERHVRALRAAAPQATFRIPRLMQGGPSADLDIGWLVELELAEGDPLRVTSRAPGARATHRALPRRRRSAGTPHAEQLPRLRDRGRGAPPAPTARRAIRRTRAQVALRTSVYATRPRPARSAPGQ